MKKFLFVPATVVALLFAFNAAIASADEKKEGAESKAGSVEEQMDNLVKQGPGIHNIKKDDKGRVQSLIVVGQSRISTVLGATKGKEVARKRAEQSAKAAFVKWLGEAVVVCENSENETTMFLQGEESKDKDAMSRGRQGGREEQRHLQVGCRWLGPRLDASSHRLECRRQGILGRVRVEPRQRQVSQGHRHARSGDRREAGRHRAATRLRQGRLGYEEDPQPEDNFARGGRVPEVA